MANDDEQVRQLVADADAYQSDVERFTGLLTEHVVVVNIAGIRVAGREEFRKIMARAMESGLSNVTTKTEISEVTFVRPDVALVSCIKHVSDERTDAPDSLPLRGSLTFLAIKEDVGWRIALAQTTPM